MTIRTICREQQGPTIDDALEGLRGSDPDDPTGSQEAGYGRARGLQANQAGIAGQVTA